MKPEQKILLAYFVVPLVVLNFVYLLFAKLAANYYYDCPSPEFLSLLKYSISKIFAMLNINFISVALPNELAKDIIAQVGINKISFSKYYIIFSNLHQAFLYQFYGTYLLASLAFCFILTVNKRLKTPNDIKRKNDMYLRGIQKISAKVYCEKTRKITHDVLIALPTKTGNLLLSEERLREHILILGSTGSGKSQLMLNMVKSLVSKDVKLIIVDRKGEFFAHFGDVKRDVLFNPYDKRGIKWDIFNEINLELDSSGDLSRVPADITILCDLLYEVNNAKSEDSFWTKSASYVLQSAMCWCIIHGKTSTADLINFLHQPINDVISELGTLPPKINVANTVLSGGAENKTALSIISNMEPGIQQLSLFANNGNSSWSVREWIHEKQSGNLFISTAGKNDDTFTSIVALLIDLIGREVKEFNDADGNAVKLCFVIDELSSLPSLSTLVFLLTQARSKGISVIIANQTFSKIRKIYGQDEAANIVANCKNKFIFALNEASDAKYMSEQIGTSEVLRKSQGKNKNISALGNSNESFSENKNITQDITILPSEISILCRGEAVVLLPNMEKYVSIVQFDKNQNQKINTEFIPIEVEEYSPLPIKVIQNNDAPPIPD